MCTPLKIAENWWSHICATFSASKKWGLVLLWLSRRIFGDKDDGLSSRPVNNQNWRNAPWHCQLGAPNLKKPRKARSRRYRGRFCKQTLMLISKHFSRSTRFAHFCTALSPEISSSNWIALKTSEIVEIVFSQQFWLEFIGFSRTFEIDKKYLRHRPAKQNTMLHFSWKMIQKSKFFVSDSESNSDLFKKRPCWRGAAIAGPFC